MYSTKANGPLPTTTFCRSPCSSTTCCGTITFRLAARNESSGVNGSESVMTTVRSSGASMLSTTAKLPARGEAVSGSLMRSIENATSAAVTGVPS